METYENIILKRIGYVLFLIVVAMHIFNIGGSEAEALHSAPETRKIAAFARYEQDGSRDVSLRAADNGTVTVSDACISRSAASPAE